MLRNNSVRARLLAKAVKISDELSLLLSLLVSPKRGHARLAWLALG